MLDGCVMVTLVETGNTIWGGYINFLLNSRYQLMAGGAVQHRGVCRRAFPKWFLSPHWEVGGNACAVVTHSQCPQVPEKFMDL